MLNDNNIVNNVHVLYNLDICEINDTVEPR